MSFRTEWMNEPTVVDKQNLQIGLTIWPGSECIDKIFSDLSSKFQKTLKKASPKFFPRVIRKCQIFGLKICIYMYKN
jgi:hypothetical protein